MKGIVKNIFWKLIVLLMMICGFLLFIHLVQAGSGEYQGNINKRLNIIISEEGVNRIAVAKDRIAKVVGNGEEYSIEGENASGVIFISSKLSAGEVSPITIITEKGFTQDISLKVKRGKEARSILIKKPLLRQRKENIRSEDIKLQAIEAIREISRGESKNYSFRRIDIATLTEAREVNAYKGYAGLIDSGIKVTKITEYTSRHLKVQKYEYEEKPAKLVLEKIAKIVTSYVATSHVATSYVFPKSLAVSERGNAIYVIYIQ